MKLPQWIRRRIAAHYEKMLDRQRDLHQSQYASVRHRAEVAEGTVAQLRSSLRAANVRAGQARAQQEAGAVAAAELSEATRLAWEAVARVRQVARRMTEAAGVGSSPLDVWVDELRQALDPDQGGESDGD